MGAGHGGMATDSTDSRHFEDRSINTSPIKRMRISFFPALISIVAAGLIAYLAFYFAQLHFDANDIIVASGSFLSVVLTLGSMIALKLENERAGINMKAWSSVAFILTVCINLGFALWHVLMPLYVIVLGLFLLIHLWIVWKMASMKDV